MKYAWVEDGRVRDICPGDPSECYAPEIAKLYCVLVPDDAASGDLWDGNTLTKPEPVKPPPVVVRAVKVPPPIEFKAGEEGLRALLAAQLDMARTRQV